VHDGTYSIDFTIKTVERPLKEQGGDTSFREKLEEKIMAELRGFEHTHGYKFLGAGLSSFLAEMCPDLPSLFWSDLDIVPFVFSNGLDKTVDEIADLMARCCIGYARFLNFPALDALISSQGFSVPAHSPGSRLGIGVKLQWMPVAKH
jgi:hypothetical protein